MNNGDKTHVGYSREDWECHYKEEDLRWDLDEVAPPFVHLWNERNIFPCKAIVPGCGAGHEVMFLAKKGFDVTAVDYTHGAIRLLEKAFKKNNYLSEVVHQDFFKLNRKTIAMRNTKCMCDFLNFHEVIGHTAYWANVNSINLPKPGQMQTRST